MADNFTSPRPLSSEEMWAGYEAPVPDFSTPFQYPAQRLTYDLFPYSQTAEKHGLRLFKLSIREQVWNLVQMGPEMESFAKMQVEDQRRLPPDITGLGKLLDLNGMRQDANRIFREGDYMTAVWRYVTNWSLFLPWHVDAFSRTHPLRPKLGEAEASLFNNISACFVRISEEAKKYERNDFSNFYMDAAFKTSWVALEMREFAKVRTVYSSAKRSLSLIRKLFAAIPSPNVTAANIDAMCAYYAVQAKVLENVNKDTMFKDLSPEKKIPWPSFDDYWAMGPFCWGTTHGLVHLNKNPVVEARRGRNQPRTLTEEELWAIWTEDVPMPTEPLEYREPADDYPEFRFCYDNMPIGRVYETRHICRAKREVYEVIFRACRDDVSGEAFEHVMRSQRERSVTSHPWGERLHAAVAKKEEGTDLYRAKNIRAALSTYIDAWAELLPHHYSSHFTFEWINSGAGSLEAKLWSNISAACIQLSKSANSDYRRSTLTLLAFISAYFSWHLREYTSVNPVKNSCTRLLATVSDASIVLTTLQPKIDTLKTLWQQQVDVLQGADGELFMAQERQKMVPNPMGGREWAEVGPQTWMGEIEKLKGKRLFD
ncbi:hypothetical protein B9479_007815 [Cryptococcus floricola]|uniref:Uncharacterized protein n=1 Tax=Cryptococcus floricola TaxID=2591691 RepID=A0A5D3ALF2_9TREE|nr:hypothetical protein B9479_007815 [Cryptococcus floricola]